jgi:hypothetical protein
MQNNYYCKLNILNITDYCIHINNHNIEYHNFDISNEILTYVEENNIELSQEKLDYEITNDGDIINMIITEYDNEKIALDLLELINLEKVSCILEIDDEEKLREYLLNKSIIKFIDCDLTKIYEKKDFEEFCYFTNNSILMHCIKKGWTIFCNKLLDYNILYDIT